MAPAGLPAVPPFARRRGLPDAIPLHYSGSGRTGELFPSWERCPALPAPAESSYRKCRLRSAIDISRRFGEFAASGEFTVTREKIRFEANPAREPARPESKIQRFEKKTGLPKK